MITKRLYFIDAVRAFAILMMLQGHFIDTLLDIKFRDKTNLVFILWEYFRGITAPTFFTISGLIFTYLIMLARKKGKVESRLKKGVVRGLMLIAIGYMLRIPIFRWFKGEFDYYFMVIDVLQCIGLSLLIIILFYNLVLKNHTVFSLLMIFTGTIIFLTEPLYRTYTATNIPLFIANYVSKANGSIFTIIPWFGYMAYGAFIATLFFRYIKFPKFKNLAISTFLLIGMFLINFSTYFFDFIYSITKIELINNVSNYNYLFIRLGNVLVLFAIFYAFERFLKIPIILKIGQKTLSIYVIHFIILYGSFTGIGLNSLISNKLDPCKAVFGAILFLVSVSLISVYRTKANTYIYARLRMLAVKIRLIELKRDN